MTEEEKFLSEPAESLLSGCINNDLQAQEALYKHCYPSMIKIAYRYAGDMDGAGIIFNNAMLRVFKNLPAYKHERKFMGWIRTIVVNCCLDFVKKRKNVAFKESKWLDHDHIGTNTDPQHLTMSEIQKIINQLPRMTATVFNLFIYEGYTHKEICGLLNIAEGTSKWHVNYGRNVLKTKLSKLLKSNIDSENK